MRSGNARIFRGIGTVKSGAKPDAMPDQLFKKDNLQSKKDNQGADISQVAKTLKTEFLNEPTDHEKQQVSTSPNQNVTQEAQDAEQEKHQTPKIIDETVADPRAHLINEPIKADETNKVPEPAFIKPGEGFQSTHTTIKDDDTIDPRKGQAKPATVSNLQNTVPDTAFKPPFSDKYVETTNKSSNDYQKVQSEKASKDQKLNKSDHHQSKARHEEKDDKDDKDDEDDHHDHEKKKPGRPRKDETKSSGDQHDGSHSTKDSTHKTSSSNTQRAKDDSSKQSHSKQEKSNTNQSSQTQSSDSTKKSRDQQTADQSTQKKGEKVKADYEVADQDKENKTKYY